MNSEAVPVSAGTRVRLRDPNYNPAGMVGTLVGDGYTGSYSVWTIDIGTLRHRSEGYIEVA